jgi:proteasome accessory factor B
MFKNSPGKSVYPSTYTALWRMNKIHQKLMDQYEGKEFMPITSKSLVEEFKKDGAKEKLSTKTIQRDINFMRQDWDLPIEYCKTEGGYRYTEWVEEFPGLKYSENEAFAFLIARNSIERYKGTHMHEPLSQFYDKIISQLPLKRTRQFERVKECVSFRSAGWSKGNYLILDKLSKACLDRKEISFDYDREWTGKQRKKNQKPLHLVNHDNAWYLVVANLEVDQKHKIYSVARMSSLKTHVVTFSEIKFSIDKFMEYNFGIFTGKKSHKVRVRFDAFAAPYIRERKWNSSQKTKNFKDGSLEFSITVNDLTEIKGWIMNWGKHAKVLGPKFLIDEVKNELVVTLENYG